MFYKESPKKLSQFFLFSLSFLCIFISPKLLPLFRMCSSFRKIHFRNLPRKVNNFLASWYILLSLDGRISRYSNEYFIHALNSIVKIMINESKSICGEVLKVRSPVFWHFLPNLFSFNLNNKIIRFPAILNYVVKWYYLVHTIRKIMNDEWCIRSEWKMKLWKWLKATQLCSTPKESFQILRGKFSFIITNYSKNPEQTRN